MVHLRILLVDLFRLCSFVIKTLFFHFLIFVFNGVTPHWECSPHRCSSAKSPPWCPAGFEPGTLAAGMRAG
jgi:hypothetical protein